MRGRSEGFFGNEGVKIWGGVDISVQSMYRDIWTLGKRECDRLKDTWPTFSNGQSAASAPKTYLTRYCWGRNYFQRISPLKIRGVWKKNSSSYFFFLHQNIWWLSYAKKSGRLKTNSCQRPFFFKNSYAIRVAARRLSGIHNPSGQLLRFNLAASNTSLYNICSTFHCWIEQKMFIWKFFTESWNQHKHFASWRDSKTVLPECKLLLLNLLEGTNTRELR